MHTQRSSTIMCEANANLKRYLEQQIPIDSYVYVEVLKRCA